MSKRAILIYNPVARGAPHPERLREAIDGLAGWEISIESTTASAHATALAREAAGAGLDAVVACGGDGTVNEVANGLAGSNTALAVVRGGTANVWAKEVHVPKQPVRALALLADGDVRTIDLGRATWRAGDLGRAGERYFLLMCGVGFDAAIVRSLGGATKQRFGAASYILGGALRLFSYRATHAELRTDAEALSTKLYWLLAGNTRSYGGLLKITDRACADDGKLDLCLLRTGGPAKFAWLAPLVMAGRHHRNVLYRHVDSLDIQTPGLPVQVDGEYLGDTPLRIEVAPAVLRVIVPRGLRSPLFGESARSERV